MSVQSTTGLSTGITDPTMPPAVEVMFILQMWIGRLEIFPVIITLRALFVWNADLLTARAGRAARPARG